MSFAFLPLYTGDYLRDTRHLTPLKHGIYLLLLMHCWDQREPLPKDEQECAGIANCRSADEIEALRYILTRFFVLMDDGWYQSRMQREIERAANISSARSQAGKLGYLAKAKQLPSKSQASDSTPTTTTATTTTTTKSKALSSSQSEHRRLAIEILEFLNKTAGRRYQASAVNLDMIACRLAEGATALQCRQVIIRKCREWLPDERMRSYARPATLFNRTKFAQYVGELVPASEEKHEV